MCEVINVIVCIRGAGKVGQKCRRVLEYSENGTCQICFADTCSNKKEFECQNDIYSIDESICKYMQGEIDFFIVPLEYQEELRESIIDELLRKKVKSSHILLFPEKNITTVEIDKMMDLYTYDCHFPHFWKQGKSEDWSCDIQEIKGRIDEVYQTEGYKLELVGKGWLRRYLEERIIDKEELGEKKESDGKEKIYVICDDSTYDLKRIFDNSKSNKYIFLYQLIMNYYYQNPVWYYSYCNRDLEATNKIGVVTGISYIKDAVDKDCFLNLANVGQDLIHDFAVFKKAISDLERKHIKINNVIIGLCPYSLRYSMEQSKVNRKKMLLYNPIIGNISKDSEYEYYDVWYNYQQGMVKSFLKKADFRFCFFHYFLPEYGKANYGNEVFDQNRMSKEELQQCREKIKRVYHKPYEGTLKQNKEVLRQYIDYANQQDFKIFFLIPPYTQLYKSAWNIEYLREVKQYLDNLRREYVFYVLDLSDEYFPDWFFYDVGHMNAAGREKITKALVEYMEKILK